MVLSVNIEKSNFIRFNHIRTKEIDSYLYINEKKLAMVINVKFLGQNINIIWNSYKPYLLLDSILHTYDEGFEPLDTLPRQMNETPRTFLQISN